MPTGSAPCAAGCCALSRLGNTRRYSSSLDREKGKHARGLFPPGASTCGDSVPAQRGVSACAGTVSEWPLADCGQRMQPLSSVAYNWPPRPHQSRTSLSTPLSVSQPGHSPLFGGPNDATLLFEFGNRARARRFCTSTCQGLSPRGPGGRLAAHRHFSFFLTSNCARRIGVTTPRPPHWSQGLVRNGRRLATVPLPSQNGQS